MHVNIGSLEVLLLIAAVVSMLARRFRLPYTVGLTLTGMVLSKLHLDLGLTLSKDLIYTAFLPPLIFEAALQIRWPDLRRDFLVILVLATAGVVISAAITTCGLIWVTSWPLTTALLLGVLISATDPVSVLATFKEARVTGRLMLLVEAESLFNDGTVAVIFGIALAGMEGGGVGTVGVATAFASVVFGGVLCGAAVGAAALALAGRTNDHLVELTLTTSAAYGSFLLAEHLHFSGVLATLTAGVVMGNVGALGSFTKRGREAVEAFWEYIAFVANSLIFLLIGLDIAHERLRHVIFPSLALIVLVTLGRALAVYGCCFLFSRGKSRVTWAHQHILVWGGLRGALALALVLGLPDSMPADQRHEVIGIAFTVVAFSVIVQGLTMKPLLRYLKEI